MSCGRYKYNDIKVRLKVQSATCYDIKVRLIVPLTTCYDISLSLQNVRRVRPSLSSVVLNLVLMYRLFLRVDLDSEFLSIFASRALTSFSFGIRVGSDQAFLIKTKASSAGNRS